MPTFGARAARAIPVALAGIALAAMVVQNATVVALAGSDPETAAKVWPGHPAVGVALATRQIAAASGSGRAIDPGTFERLDQAAQAAPLEPQPFIVAGVRAQIEGQSAKAEQAFEAARLRDPRSLPARYFLATAKLQRGEVEGLRDVAALARLEPNGGKSLVPYLASFAGQKRARGAIRAMFRTNPGIRDAVLTSLASDPANLQLVLALGGTADAANAPWLRTMMASLIASRQYSQALSLWERSVGTRSAGLFDPDFRNASAPPPFNWELTSSSLGLAERRSGRLQVIFYGQDSGTLARQLLLLSPGQYRLTAPTSGSGNSDALFWLVRCDGGSTELGRAPVRQNGLRFEVPAGCPAQWLELVGTASDFGREAETTIGAMTLSRVATR